MSENTITLIVVLGMGVVALVNRRWDRIDAAVKEKKAELAAEAARVESARVAAQAHKAAVNAQLATERAASKARKVKKVLVNTTAATNTQLNDLAVVAIETQKTGEKTHDLVNSQYGVQLRLGAELSRWKADKEPTKENLAAAKLAEKLFHDHEAKQAKVDAKDAKDA